MAGRKKDKIQQGTVPDLVMMVMIDFQVPRRARGEAREASDKVGCYCYGGLGIVPVASRWFLYSMPPPKGLTCLQTTGPDFLQFHLKQALEPPGVSRGRDGNDH